MVNLTKQVLAEKENVETALSNLREAMAREEKSGVELAAIGNKNGSLAPINRGAFWSTAGGRSKGFSRKSTEGISNNHRCLAKCHFPACRQAGANKRVNG